MSAQDINEHIINVHYYYYYDYYSIPKSICPSHLSSSQCAMLICHKAIWCKIFKIVDRFQNFMQKRKGRWFLSCSVMCIFLFTIGGVDEESGSVTVILYLPVSVWQWQFLCQPSTCCRTWSRGIHWVCISMSLQFLQPLFLYSANVCLV